MQLKDMLDPNQIAALRKLAADTTINFHQPKKKEDVLNQVTVTLKKRRISGPVVVPLDAPSYRLFDEETVNTNS